MNRRMFVGLIAAAGFAGSRSFKIEAQSVRTKTPGLPRMLEVTRAPGVAVAGIRDGRAFQLVEGVVAANGARITTDTQFPAASLSKPVFAWVVRDLAKQGKLDLNRPLQDYLNLGLEGISRKIAPVHVLTHSTGLPNWRFQADRQLASAFEPGSRWQYSGEGFFLLQRVVEKIVGQPIATYIKTAALAPFGMTMSSFGWTPEIQTRAAAGHDRQGALFERSVAFYEKRNYETIQKSGLTPESATYENIVSAYEQSKQPFLPVAASPNMAGSLQTTAADYAKFLSRVMEDTSLRPEDFKPRVEVNRDIAWTLGWGVDRSFKSASLFHWGDSPGFKNFCWVQPARKTALVFFTNGDSGAALYAWLFRQLMNEDPSAFYWI